MKDPLRRGLRYLCLILIIMLTIGPLVYISATHGGFGVPVHRSTGCTAHFDTNVVCGLSLVKGHLLKIAGTFPRDLVGGTMAGRNECGGCGLIFGSLGAFDMHRIGSFGDTIYKPGDTVRKNPIGYTPSTRRCMTLDEIIAASMVQNEKGWWIIGRFDASAMERLEEPEEEEVTS